jgi:hypothetical protein
MFRIVSLIVFAAVLGCLVLHYLVFPCGRGRRFTPSALIRKCVHLFTLLFLEQSLNWGGRLRKLAFLLGLLSFIILLLTGFLPLLLGGRLEGYWLMLHMTFAPIFIACAAVVVMTGAERYRLLKKDVEHWAQLRSQQHVQNACWLTDCTATPKVGFWLLAAISLPLTLTMAVSMTTLFGTEGQQWLFDAHRWCALAFAAAALCELYVLCRQMIRRDCR